MKQAQGNMLYVDCDALVITTNGFVKAHLSTILDDRFTAYTF